MQREGFLTLPGGFLHIKMHKQDLDDNCIDLFVLVQPDWWGLSDLVPPEQADGAPQLITEAEMSFGNICMK